MVKHSGTAGRRMHHESTRESTFVDRGRATKLIPDDLILLSARAPDRARHRGKLAPTRGRAKKDKKIINGELIIDTYGNGWHKPVKDDRSRVGDVPTGRTSVRNGATGQGSNSVQVRQYNERVILTLLRRLGEA